MTMVYGLMGNGGLIQVVVCSRNKECGVTILGSVWLVRCTQSEVMSVGANSFIETMLSHLMLPYSNRMAAFNTNLKRPNTTQQLQSLTLHFSIWQSVRLSIAVFLGLSISLYICLYVFCPIPLSASLSLYLSVSLTRCLSAPPPLSPCLPVSIYVIADGSIK